MWYKKLLLLIAFINFLLIAKNYAADRNFCEDYAKEAQKAVNDNKQYQCGFTGLRWSEDIEGQKQWCLTIRQGIAINETRVRTKKIRECLAQHINKKKDQTATKAPVLIAKRYVDNKNGTITDTKTKLMWKKCTEGLEGENCNKGKPKEVIWDVAKRDAAASHFAGYTDWRLPTREELITLIYCSNGKTDLTQKKLRDVHYTGGCQKEEVSYDFKESRYNYNYFDSYQEPTINLQVFPGTLGSFYWTSTRLSINEASVWYISFIEGEQRSHYADYYPGPFRLVRKLQETTYED